MEPSETPKKVGHSYFGKGIIILKKGNVIHVDFKYPHGVKELDKHDVSELADDLPPAA